MNPGSPEFDELALRTSVRSWVADAWDPVITLREWWRRLADSGWGFPGWPSAWFGQDLPPLAAGVVHDELAAAGVIGPPTGVGTSMAAPALFRFGTDEQRARWIPKLAYGEIVWAQFFSEPGAGSDLAGLQARAVRDGDDWVVNGQKIWNSGTSLASAALLLARTDLDAPKHHGITCFVLDLDQDGIDIRPIKQMNGQEEFNETFITDARVPDANRIGDVNAGWAVAMTVLTHERSTYAGGGHRALRIVSAGDKAGFLDKTLAELLVSTDAERAPANALPIGTVEAMIELAREHGRLQDPMIRQRIAVLLATSEALRLTAARGQAAAAAGRRGEESSVAYLGGVLVVRLCRDLVAEIAGPYALLDDSDVYRTITTAPAHGIQGGSEQIQRNVIAERILGLPREPQVDRDVPFRELRIGTQRDAG